MLLDWIARIHGGENFGRAAPMTERAVAALLGHPETRTQDLGGPLGAASFTAAPEQELEWQFANDG